MSKVKNIWRLKRSFSLDGCAGSLTYVNQDGNSRVLYSDNTVVDHIFPNIKDMDLKAIDLEFKKLFKQI
jgi:hypothetical protein